MLPGVTDEFLLRQFESLLSAAALDRVMTAYYPVLLLWEQYHPC